MSNIRTYFQKDLSALETFIKIYKDSYPRNFGEMVQRAFPVFMMILGVLMLLHSIAESSTEWIGQFLTSGVIFVFGLALFLILRKKVYKSNPDVAKQKLERFERDYGRFPDIKQYVEKCNTDLTSAIKYKRKIKMIFYILFGGFFLVFSIKTVIGVTLRAKRSIERDNGKISNVIGNDGICAMLNIDGDTPLLRLTPLTSANNTGIKALTDTLEIYLSELSFDNETGSPRALSFINPGFNGLEPNDLIRLKITDKNGVPIPRCPDFLFTNNEKGIIKSNGFQLYEGTKHQNSFMMLQTLYYLQENKNDLRFKAEKI